MPVSITIAEICTAGGYVPDRHAPVSAHSIFPPPGGGGRRVLPLFLTVIAGCDAWSAEQSVDFLGRR